MIEIHPRSIARELALLSLSQSKAESEQLQKQDIKNLVETSVRTLVIEVRETLEEAKTEIDRGHERLIASEIRSPDVETSRKMVYDGLSLAQEAIKKVDAIVDISAIVALAHQQEAKDYALEIIATVYRRRQEIQKSLEDVMVDWGYNRLAKIDRDILRVAVGEIAFLGVSQSVAINEAVKLAKKYSEEEGHKFINGVLRRFVDKLALTNSNPKTGGMGRV